MPSTRNLAILIFADVKVLDFCGPFEVFSVANRSVEPAAFNVFTIAERPGPVVTHNGLSVNPHYVLNECPQPHILLVPGGRGTRAEMHNSALIEWIKRKASTAELVLSVCTGALLLAKAGLLEGLEATFRDDQVVVLKGSVPNAAAKTKAVQLARDTVGVNSVVDELAVARKASQ